MTIKSYLLKITLDGIAPAIWRRFVLPADISLDRLHDVIQIVMGWQDSHLHEFILDGKRFTEDPESPEDGENEERFRLCDLVKRIGKTFKYHYDFGDSWMHQVVVEETNHTLPSHDAPIACLEGKRACPPEDVGGVPGYDEFCKAISDRENPSHDEYMDWYAGFGWYEKTFDSEKFDLGKVNLELLKYFR